MIQHGNSVNSQGKSVVLQASDVSKLKRLAQSAVSQAIYVSQLRGKQSLLSHKLFMSVNSEARKACCVTG